MKLFVKLSKDAYKYDIFYQRKKIDRKYLLYIHEISAKDVLVYLSYRISKSQILRCCQSLFGFESVQNLLAVNILFLFSIAAGFRLRFICYWLSIVEKVLMCLDLWCRMYLHKTVRNLIALMLDSTNALMNKKIYLSMAYMSEFIAIFYS